MLSRDPINFDISLDGNRYLRPGEDYRFVFRINHLILNNTFVTEVRTIRIILEKGLSCEVPINRIVPFEISGSLGLPRKITSWHPIVFINGIDEYGYPQQIPFLWTRPIINTHHHPIYDARLGRSNWTIDEHKVIQIKNMLNEYGFDCSTIGKEIQPTVAKGKDLMNFEKQWASGGDCFIAILTPRDRIANGRLALPPPWIVTESGLSYDSNRPHLVFVEKGVDRVALFREMDATHIIGFQVIGNKVYFENNISEKLLQFRTESQIHQTDKKLQGIGQFIFLGLALYGGWKFLDDLLSE